MAQLNTTYRNLDENSATDVNILLLGATGTGKTTFINAIANYISFDTLEQAVQGNMQVLIPSSFSCSVGDDFEDRNITIGNPDEFENLDNKGESATQLCRSFVMQIGHRKLRIIDAPGVGDTRGIEQDDRNFQEILTFISQYDHINALCVLVKSNEERLGILFRFCISEVLRHLHVNSRENLIFVFTNVRSTFYRPGKSKSLLKTIFDKYQKDHHIDIPLTNNNVFAFDNEAFRYLAICKNNVQLVEDQIESYHKSWTHSTKEILRFLTYACNLPRHPVRNISSLNEVEQLVRKLPRPIAETARLIETNIRQAKRYEGRVLKNECSPHEGIPQNLGRIRRLNHPRTVCASERCRSLIEDDDEMRFDYKSICHDECYLKQVQQETLGHPELEECTAIDYKTGMCHHCGCNWQSHKHITYEYISNRTRLRVTPGTGPVVIDRSIFLNDIDGRIRCLREELRVIQETYKQFAKYLSVKAMLPFNDAFLDYLEYFIREESSKREAGEQNHETIDNLRALAEDFKNHIAKFIGAVQEDSADDNNDQSVENVLVLARQLFKLPITGALIEEQVNAISQGQRQTAFRRENLVQFSKEAFPSKIMKELIHIFNQSLLHLVTDQSFYGNIL